MPLSWAMCGSPPQSSMFQTSSIRYIYTCVIISVEVYVCDNDSGEMAGHKVKLLSPLCSYFSFLPIILPPYLLSLSLLLLLSFIPSLPPSLPPPPSPPPSPFPSLPTLVYIIHTTTFLSILKTKDEYGEVTRLARPLPLEYLIIELTTTTPIKPNPFLPGGNGNFPITNREFQVTGYRSMTHEVSILRIILDCYRILMPWLYTFGSSQEFLF